MTTSNALIIKLPTKEEGRKITLKLKDCELTPVVSRMYHHLFNAM